MTNRKTSLCFNTEKHLVLNVRPLRPPVLASTFRYSLFSFVLVDTVNRYSSRECIFVAIYRINQDLRYNVMFSQPTNTLINTA